MTDGPFIELSALAERWCVATHNRRESTKAICRQLGVRLVRLSWSQWLARLDDVIRVEREVRRTRIVPPSTLHLLNDLRKKTLRRACG